MGSDETASLARPRCPNCATSGVPGARFCSNCGTRLDASAIADATFDIGPLIDEPPSEPIPLPSDRPPAGAVLIVQKGAFAGTAFDLAAPVTRIGRSPESHIFLDDVTVSRDHAEVLHVSTGWMLRDKGSLNGTYVNDDRTNEAHLQHGDRVQIGKFKFIFRTAA